MKRRHALVSLLIARDGRTQIFNSYFKQKERT